VQKGTPVGQ